MSGMFFVVMAAVFCFGVYYVVNEVKRVKSLNEDGKIIGRDVDFEEYAELFTIRDVEFKDIREELRNADYSGRTNIKADMEKKLVNYEGVDWKAHLYYMTNETDRNAYCFEFTEWSTRKGLTQNITDMNVALTAIEKVFLKIDPNTQVSKRKNITRRNPRFF